jgi:hypothetical protein
VVGRMVIRGMRPRNKSLGQVGDIDIPKSWPNVISGNLLINNDFFDLALNLLNMAL